MTTPTRASARARNALARLEEAASSVRCLELVLYRSARAEAIRRREPLLEHSPGVPAADPAEQPPIAAVLRGEEWLAGGRPGAWRGLLCDLHWELMQEREPAPGSLRRGAAWVRGRSPTHARRRFPEPKELPRLLAALEHAIDTERDPLLAAANAHSHFALLHPFRDGNGRVAQALSAVVLRERGLLSRPCLLLGTALYPGRSYVSALDRLRSGDERSWVRFFLATIERAATEAAVVCEAVRARLETDARRLRAGRARRLLWALGEGALPVRDLGRDRGDALRALREAGIAKVVTGLFGDPIAFHAGLARIVAAPPGTPWLVRSAAGA